jgi:hypothetical protein
MAKTKELEQQVADLRAVIAGKDKALTAARNGLFRIINTSPTTFPIVPGGKPTIVRALDYVQGKAEETVLKMSDLDPETANG